MKGKTSPFASFPSGTRDVFSKLMILLELHGSFQAASPRLVLLQMRLHATCPQSYAPDRHQTKLIAHRQKGQGSSMRYMRSKCFKGGPKTSVVFGPGVRILRGSKYYMTGRVESKRGVEVPSPPSLSDIFL